MKKKITSTAFLAFLLCFSCADDDSPTVTAPTAAEYTAIKDAALNSFTETYSFFADGSTDLTFTSDSGVDVTIHGSALYNNGTAVTGEITVKYVELFSRGQMLVTNKTTMGVSSDGVMDLLVSGGEFYVQAYQENQELDTDGIIFKVPTSLTGPTDDLMSGFAGQLQPDGGVVWIPIGGQGFYISTVDNTDYYNAFSQNFGWYNCDRFIDYPGAKTEIAVTLPNGFNNTNCGVFIGLENDANSLGNLAGQYPVGEKFHIIFASVHEGNWRYAVKSVTLVSNASYTFTENELQTASQTELVNIINALP